MSPGRWVLLTLLLAMAVAGCSSGHHSAAPVPVHEAPPGSTTVKAKAGGPATWLGSDGIQSAAIIAENRMPGTAGWKITSQGSGAISGFADKNYAAAGDAVRLYVSTTAPSFRVVAYRMGWYQGLGARTIWSSPLVPGRVQPPCPVAPQTNMVSCANWKPSLTMTITSAFVPGDYLLKLTGSGAQQSYVLLTVWEPDSTAAYLIMNRSLVEQGWNTYGGYSFYQGEGRCILDQDTYPPCNRARVVSFDRPYVSPGSSDFLDNEYPLVEFSEEQGLDVTYCTDICVSDHPAIVMKHRALIGLDHDETWTNSERTAVINAFRKGVNMAFLGAATLVRHARLAPSVLGSDREEVDYRNSTEDPLSGHGDPMEVTGNTWSSPPTGWDAASFVGVEYSGYIEANQPAAPMVVYDASAWIFKGTGLTNGQQVPDAIGSDIDHIDASGQVPSNLEVLAHSPISLSEAYTNQGKWGGYTYSDMVYYTDTTSQAGLFSSGNNIWVGAMSPCSAAQPSCPGPLVDRMTANLLWLFGQGPAGKLVAAIPNWRTVTPAGS